MELLNQWECTKIILIYVAKLPFIEVLPTSVLPTMDVRLNRVHFWPFPPNVSFRNHEVAKDPPTGCGVFRGKVSCDWLLASGFSRCSWHEISLRAGESSSEAHNLGPVALSCEQTNVILRGVSGVRK